MKIIKPGKLKKLHLIKQTCTECGCVFEYTQDEGKVEYDQRESGAFIRITCPEPGCGSQLIHYLK